VKFSEYMAENQERLKSRRQELLIELAEIHAEMHAIRAYEIAKRDRLMIHDEASARAFGEPQGKPASARAGGAGRYPHDDGTLSVPQAGREFLGLSESGSWLAARRGDIPAVKIGRYRRVPVDAMRRKLEERRAAQ
jgi:hypothetical protein